MKIIIKTIIAALGMLMAFSIGAMAQTQAISGVVSGATGENLVGVTVFVKGTTIGAETDDHGKYSIKAKKGETLVFSLIGYKDLEVVVGDKTKVDAVLAEDAILLQEAVAIGYGNQSKLTLTGSVAQTSGTALQKNSTVNLSQGLAGRISGVIVNNRSGEPGKDDATMFIRGRSTLGDNTPLIIIDGVPGREEDFGRLTGEEIESVNVLKDASGAIYGSRSANGVILVTTKRGKYQEAPKIVFTYDLGLQQPTRLVQMADAVLYTQAYNSELAITGGAAYYNSDQVQHYIDQDDPILYPNTNWFKEIIKNFSQQHKYGVSINGGSERVAYFVDFNGQYQDGIYKKSATNFNQYNVRSNIDIKVTKRLTLGFDLNARQQHKNYSAFPSDSYGIFYIATRMKPTGAAYYPNGYLRGGTNPAVLVQDLTGYDKTTINTVNTTFTLNYDMGYITKGLSANAHLAYDLVSTWRKNWQKDWTYWSYDEITETYDERTSSYWATPVLRQYQTHTYTTTINANVNYDRDFDGHHVTALAGFEQSSYRKDYFRAAINQYDSDILDEFFAGSANKNWYDIYGNAQETARRSFFGRVGYDYKSKYLIQALIRFDGSENFPANNRWGTFPGVSAGWRISEEPFFKENVHGISNLKLRASYGEQGNDRIDAFQYLTMYSYSNDSRYKYEMGGSEVKSIVPGTVPNPNVTWEVARTWNVGIDGSLNKSLLTWELEFFNTTRSNILCTRNASIPYYSGLTNNLPDENIGIVRNRGVELQLSHENQAFNGDLLYHINGNFMYAKNTILYMDETPWGEGHEYMNLTGHPMGASLYYQVAGVNKTQEDLDSHPQMSGATLGDFYYEDLDGDGKITTFDRKRCDLTSVPQIVFGFGGDATYKNWDFSVLFQGQGLSRYYYAPLTDPVSGNVEKNAALNAWNLKNTSSDYPRLGSNVSNGSVTRSSFYYKNSAFLRLKNVEIGYTFPEKFFGPKFGVKGLRIYFAGYNLFTFSQLTSVDPETGDESFQTYPQVRIINFGAKLSF
jgi:TonB-linked SusC/RagA family outer membrane protein